MKTEDGMGQHCRNKGIQRGKKQVEGLKKNTSFKWKVIQQGDGRIFE